MSSYVGKFQARRNDGLHGIHLGHYSQQRTEACRITDRCILFRPIHNNARKDTTGTVQPVKITTTRVDEVEGFLQLVRRFTFSPGSRP